MQNKGLCEQSLTQLAELIRKKEVSPVEVVEAHLERISSLNQALNSIVTLASNMTKSSQGALRGVPITVKDTIETAGIRTTSGSRIRADYVPVRDAPAVARLKAAGAIILGKTNAAE